MSDHPEARKKSRYGAETRYGMPAADQIIINRHYTIGYSYYFRQAKWALEIVDDDMIEVPRVDTFRPDYRIPQQFRTDLAIYKRSGYDRGHLVASANQGESKIQNSETFLLSNMSPQKAKFNRGIWKELEGAVRKLNASPKILETYVICGPIFNFDIPVKTLRTDGDKHNKLPIPHAFYKSVLIEDDRGRFRMWSFLMPNEESKKSLDTFLVTTRKVERYSGLLLWEGLVGNKIDREKDKVRTMWKM